MKIDIKIQQEGTKPATIKKKFNIGYKKIKEL